MNTLIVHKKLAALSVEHPAEAAALRIVSVAIVVTLFAYAYLVSMTALNVIAGKEAGARSAALEGVVGTLQQRYFSLSDATAATPATALGLTAVVNTDYVYRPSSLGVAYTADNAN